ncbi:MAG: hypothetical protein ACRBF0_11635 [Calditrichia bacterium]
MPHILKNDELSVHIDLPGENYNSTRFDQTGKITDVLYRGIRVSGVERTDAENENSFGKGFYNEFGIDAALGFDEAEVGGRFHKIGVGLLRKDDDQYQFNKRYELQPAKFEVITESNRVLITCKSQSTSGYAYMLEKEIVLHDSAFTLKYRLHNTGEKDIVTDEYVHNFTAINDELMGPDYQLIFPFQLNPDQFTASVNPEQVISIDKHQVNFTGSPGEQFFFSHLNGKHTSVAKWELWQLKSKIGLSETGSFQTNKINLWGWKHVISPELFFYIHVKPGQSTEWSRTYDVFRLD